MRICVVIVTTILTFSRAQMMMPVDPYNPIAYPSIPIHYQHNRQGAFTFGPCRVVFSKECPDPEITFYLYSQRHPEMPEYISIGSTPGASNLSTSQFDPRLPTKIIVHGYNSNMFLAALVEIKKEYLRRGNLNVFAVEWSTLAAGPCYPAAVWNARLAGKCSAQLVERIRETGASDIHVIGFSLGAHVINFIANNLPFKIPRVTGLDPAMPGFVTASSDNKLDESDAEFVDVIHTNAFMQGTVQRSGHVDFYVNGGIIQPGCWAENRFFACNHHRAPIYFAESINTQIGFYGWPCSNYFNYLIGMCPIKEPQILMGELVDRQARGIHLVITESVSPYAVGKYTGPSIEIFAKTAERDRLRHLSYFRKRIMEFPDFGVPSLSENAEIDNEVDSTFANDILSSIFELPTDIIR